MEIKIQIDDVSLGPINSARVGLLLSQATLGAVADAIDIQSKKLDAGDMEGVNDWHEVKDAVWDAYEIIKDVTGKLIDQTHGEDKP